MNFVCGHETSANVGSKQMGDLRSSERKEGHSLPRGRENKETSKELLKHRGTEIHEEELI